MPLADNSAAEIHDELFFEVTYHAAYEPMRAVRTKRWKYIRRFADRGTPVLCNCDDGESKSLWLQNDWKDMGLPQEALYDLVFDPNETNNLAPDPQSKAVLEDMKGRLERWMKDTADPLLDGPVPAPPGAEVNDVNSLSPRDKTKNAGQP